MKNEHILPNTVVPKELRLEIYKEAFGEVFSSKSGLCMLLPKLLWGIGSFDNAPNGEEWYYYHTENMFPEIEGISNATDNIHPFELRVEIRERYLKSAIEKLSL